MAYSYVQYEADGGTQTFSVTFSFISITHVKAYVDDVEDTTFTWPTTSTITLSAMPDAGAVVLIKRVTPKDARLVDYVPGNTVSEDNLDTDSDQGFYSMQEILEEHADKLGLDIDDSEWDAESHQIKNVTDPTEAQHAVTKNYIDSTFTEQLNTAVTAAELAETNAVAAKTAAETAETNAETAETAAELAETNAETAETAAEAAQVAAEDTVLDYYFPNPNETDQGVTGAGATIKAYVDIIGSNKATLYLRHTKGTATTTFTLTTSEVLPTNITVIIEDGAIIDGAGTLTFYRPEQIQAGKRQQIFGNSITLMFTKPGTVYPEWMNIDGVADNIQIQALVDSCAGHFVDLDNDTTYVTAANIIVSENTSIAGSNAHSGNMVTRNVATIQPTNAVTKVFHVSQLRSGLIKNLEIDFTNSPAATDVRGISIEGSWYFHAEDILMHGLTDNLHCGVYATEGPTSGPYWLNLTRITVRGEGAGHDMNGYGVGFYLKGVSGKGANAILMLSCSGLNAGYGMKLDYAGSVSIINSQFENLRNDGILATNGTSNVIPETIGGEISWCGGYGINGQVLVHNTSLNNNSSGNFTKACQVQMVIKDTPGNELDTPIISFKNEIKKEVTSLNKSTVVTSGTGQDVLGSVDLFQYFDDIWNGVHIKASGFKTGAAGNKTVILHFGTHTITFNPANNDIEDWCIDATIFFITASSFSVIWNGGRSGAYLNANSEYFATEDFDTGAITLKITGECADGADIIKQRTWLVEAF